MRLLEAINTIVTVSPPNLSPSSKRVALYGMPGSGKAQLLLKFAKDYKATRPDCNVFHVDATTRENLVQGFEAIHALLLLARETRQEIMIEVVKDWLTKSTGWLLLVDNIVSTTVIRHFLPANDSGVILFTTRDELVARTLGTSGKLELLPMDLDECIDLVLKCAGMDLEAASPEDRQRAAELGHEVGGLPLAIDQSATCLYHRRWTLSKYLDLLRREKVETLKLNPLVRSSNFYDTFTLALKHVQPVAIALLKLMAQLDYHNIPMELLEVAIKKRMAVLEGPGVEGCRADGMGNSRALQHIKPKIRGFLSRLHAGGSDAITQASSSDVSRTKRNTPETHSKSLESRTTLQLVFSHSEELENAISILSGTGLIARKQEGNICLHDLVHEMSQNLIDPGKESLFSSFAVTLCDSYFPSNIGDPENWRKCEQISTHALTTLRHAQEVGIELAQMCRLRYNLAWYYRSRARFDDALEFYKAAWSGYKKISGPEHPDTLSAINYVAVVLDTLGRYDESLEWFQQALDGYKKQGTDNPSALDIIHDIATVFQSQGRYDEELKGFEQALAGYEKLHGQYRPMTLTSVNNIAAVYLTQARYDEAFVWLQRALSGYEKVHGKDHPWTLTTVCNIGVLFHHQARYEEALQWFQRSLTGAEKIHGKNHPLALTAVHSMALVFEAQGHSEKALEWLERALCGFEIVHGKDHPSTLLTVNCIAKQYQAQERYDEALEMFERVLAGCEKVQGKDHPSTLLVINNMAIMVHNQGRNEQAQVLFERVLAGSEKIYGKDHPLTLAAVFNLGWSVAAQQRCDEALKLFERALVSYEKALGKDHPTTLNTVTAIAIILQVLKRYQDALDMFRRALAAYGMEHRKDHLATFDNIRTVARMSWSDEKHDIALALYQLVLPDYEKIHGNDHPKTLEIVNSLAVVTTNQGRYEEAWEWYERALAGKENVHGKDHPSTLKTVNNMGIYFASQGQYEEALEWFERAWDGRMKALGADHEHTQTSASWISQTREQIQKLSKVIPGCQD